MSTFVTRGSRLPSQEAGRVQDLEPAQDIAGAETACTCRGLQHVAQLRGLADQRSHPRHDRWPEDVVELRELVGRPSATRDRAVEVVAMLVHRGIAWLRGLEPREHQRRQIEIERELDV